MQITAIVVCCIITNCFSSFPLFSHLLLYYVLGPCFFACFVPTLSGGRHIIYLHGYMNSVVGTSVVSSTSLFIPFGLVFVYLFLLFLLLQTCKLLTNAQYYCYDRGASVYVCSLLGENGVRNMVLIFLWLFCDFGDQIVFYSPSCSLNDVRVHACWSLIFGVCRPNPDLCPFMRSHPTTLEGSRHTATVQTINVPVLDWPLFYSASDWFTYGIDIKDMYLYQRSLTLFVMCISC